MGCRAVALGLCFLASSLVAQTSARHLTDAQWREDMQAMRQAMVANHKNLYHSVTPQRLEQSFAALDHDLPDLSDAQITVRLVAIAALVNDGHSGIAISFRPGLSHVGLWMVSYPDGVYVEEASAENKSLLGARLDRIGGVPIDEALARIHTIYSCEPGNCSHQETWPLSMFLADPLVLNGLGLSNSPDAATYTLNKDGRVETVTLKPLVNGRDLHPFVKGWQHAITAPGEQPIANPWSENIAFAEVPSAHAIYLQFNSVYPPPDQTMDQFAAKLEQFIATHSDDRLVIDLRHNSGGDNTNLRPLLLAIERSRFNHRGHLFVLIGPTTFSAAQNFTNRLENVTEAIFVGQPSGSNPNMYGDPKGFVLPNSHLDVRMANIWWQDEDPRDDRTATVPEVAIPPDTFADALAGKDAALAYALHAPAPQRLEDLITAAAQHDHDQALAALNAYTADPQHRYASDIEARLNILGYRLIQTGDAQSAVIVLQVTADTHPNSWNAFDSLGDGFQALHDNPHAIAAYRRSLELNPSNTHAQEEIERLQNQH
jgi:tetratricopeptide (TPR) repeat protein